MPLKQSTVKKKKTGQKKSTKKIVEVPMSPKKDSLLKKYNIALRTHERRSVLLEDAKHFGTLKILKQLNLMRDYNQWNPRIHELITKDLEYLEKHYQKEKYAS